MSDGCDLLELLSSPAVEQRVPADTRCAVLQFPDPVPDPACTGLNTSAGILPTESSELDRFDRGVLHGHLRCRLLCEVPGPVGDRSGSARCQRCSTRGRRVTAVVHYIKNLEKYRPISTTSIPGCGWRQCIRWRAIGARRMRAVRMTRTSCRSRSAL